ncbi:hypothetical protein [Xanthomonas euvesicatoria]|uniref:hypothetical protein n=1 Tax=Xanthomonas euvesicatoria TaxID=456327 RepID=UPI001C43EC6C|nr:hypothetical protein [Xanthomonas euvesicatoria]MBV6831280.1 hypothetical protein [Xanthomonas campestris pv. viegasii]
MADKALYLILIVTVFAALLLAYLGVLFGPRRFKAGMCWSGGLFVVSVALMVALQP